MRTTRIFRIFTPVLYIAISLQFTCCEEVSYTYEIDPLTHDTINRTVYNLKQGLWIIKTDCANDFAKLPSDTLSNFDSIGISKNQGYIFVTNPAVRHSGYFVDNRKQGVWTSYDEKGAIVRIEKFKNDCPVTDQ